MNIYLNDETNFERNGLGFLTECISANVTESLNGDYILQIEYPLNAPMSEYLVEGNIIKSNVGNNNYQLFRINRVTKDFETIQVYALHISYDLLNNMSVISDGDNLIIELPSTYDIVFQRNESDELLVNEAYENITFVNNNNELEMIIDGKI